MAGFALGSVLQFTIYMTLLLRKDWQEVADAAAERMKEETK